MQFKGKYDAKLEFLAEGFWVMEQHKSKLGVCDNEIPTKHTWFMNHWEIFL